LRITVKSVGDDSARLQRVRPGTHVFAEGPFGTFTPAVRRRRKVLLVAGGIGVTPLRAIVESLPGRPGDIMMLYRIATPDDAVFRHELQELAQTRGIALYVLPGTEIGDDNTDLLGVPALAKGVPDIRSRDCFICGPPSLIDAMRRRLAILDVSREQVHFEGFEFYGDVSVRRVAPVIIATLLGLGVLATFKTSPSSAVRHAATTPPTSRPPASAPPPSGSASTAPSGASSSASSSATRSIDGDVVSNQYGDVQVRITVSGNQVTDIQALQMPSDRARSAEISQQAEPLLRQEALQAKSAQIDIVSGATFTSESYAQSLQSALDRAGI
jgi:ferredoxin-NADP reductase/uncharacterized protein with FMN-binding domain